ncbi:succinate dehydrogenase cytochrome b560 subunit, mitochondrial-like [Ischnura elegans]|uniref:succinate dehydrogenase cytochrome b560 subunit, mitochondrial-like n=1 Tax=Ischnura elegans TaxID=197161 RepID=UPI001ED87875|nr:succinate dehydrogenase cytochrome b560 subunit, mitochondrial-like [Ischnura elegans]
MALSTVRMGCLRLNPMNSIIRSIYCTRPNLVTLKVVSVKDIKKSDETFIQRNERIGRPLSPHLSIYKPQLTSLLSLTHRTTGIIMSGIIYGVGIGALILPSNIPHYVDWLASFHFNPAFLYVCKAGLAFPMAYHYLNGIRHLAWDYGMGFKIKDLYKSGYVVLAISIITALGLASL